MNQHNSSDPGQASPSEYSSAEAALDCCIVLFSDRDAVDCYEGLSALGGVDTLIARTALSVEFKKRSKGFQLRAIVEGWDLQRLVREMY